MRGLIHGLSIVLLLAGVAGAQDDVSDLGDVPGRARLAMVKAAAAREQGRFADAAEVLHELLAARPQDDHPLLRYHLGAILMLDERNEEAALEFRSAVDLAPAFSSAWLGLGQVAYTEGDYGTAGEAFEQAFRHSDQPDPVLLYHAGASLLLAGDPNGGAQLLEELVAGYGESPDQDWFRALISACVDLGDQPRGERAVAGLLQHYPDDPEAWRLAFQHAATYGDHLQAAIALRIRSYLTPLDKQETLQLADLYRLLEAPALAGELYASALGEAPEPRDWERLVSTYIEAHDPVAARRVLRDALTKAPSPRLWSLLGDLAALDEDHAAAFEAYAACAELDPDDGRTWLMAGYCALEAGRYGEARRCLQKARRFADQREPATALLARLEAVTVND